MVTPERARDGWPGFPAGPVDVVSSSAYRAGRGRCRGQSITDASRDGMNRLKSVSAAPSSLTGGDIDISRSLPIVKSGTGTPTLHVRYRALAKHVCE